MHDIKSIRNNPKKFDQTLKDRNLKPVSEKVLKLDAEIRKFKTKLQEVQENRNLKSRKIGLLIKENKDPISLQNEVKELKNKLTLLEENIRNAELDLNKILMSLPNILDEDVPIGFSEDENKLVKKWGKIKNFGFIPQDHVKLGERNNEMDFKTGAKLSGSRFVLMRNDLALLERSLITFMLDTNIKEFGHQEISPPYLVNSAALTGTGQLPKFSEDLFETNDGKWLIPTSEVPLTNIVSNEILKEQDLPFNFVSYSPCFRSEAGAAGKDTRGMIRQHQFSKVEMVSIVNPKKSNLELERMTKCAELILQKLELPYRVIILCSGDTGFSSKKTYDIEVWLPGQNDGKGEYREISSCSNCGDFQSRRMNSRFREQETKDIKFVHTLNGSCLAVGRTMIALIENYQNEDGSVEVPKILQPYMHGKQKILLKTLS
tara:strand:- start:641 stop:1936 length:1296 start_codon:yes stop_codon:yes gene_type:complete